MGLKQELQHMISRDIEVGFSKKPSFKEVRTMAEGLCCDIRGAATSDVRKGMVWEAEKEAKKTQCLQTSKGVAVFWKGYEGCEIWYF